MASQARDENPRPWQGRVGAARLQRGQDEVTATVMYWLPKPSRGADKKAYEDTLYEMSLSERITTEHTKEKHALHHD